MILLKKILFIIIGIILIISPNLIKTETNFYNLAHLYLGINYNEKVFNENLAIIFQNNNYYRIENHNEAIKSFTSGIIIDKGDNYCVLQSFKLQYRIFNVDEILVKIYEQVDEKTILAINYKDCYELEILCD